MTEKEKNRELIKEYPFLDPRNWETFSPADYDFEYTELDDMPSGWRTAFGKQMCDEIKEELIRCDYLEQYRILEIKEKFGSLRWYDAGIPEDCKVWDIIKKYEKLSAVTCIKCGRPATKISRGWISPWCDDCAKDHIATFTDINEYYEKWEGLKSAEEM